MKLSRSIGPGERKTEVRFVNAVTAAGNVKFFARCVNFSKNNEIYNINESTFHPDFISRILDILLINSFIAKKCPNY